MAGTSVRPVDREANAPNDQGELAPDDASWAELTSLRAKIVELEALTHKLRVENLALRTRIERATSGRYLEKRLLIFGGMLIWLFFIYQIGSKMLMSAMP